MALLFYSTADSAKVWIPELKRQLSHHDIRQWPDIGDASEIDYALMWKPEPGVMASLPNLKVIFSIGAGIDHLVKDPDMPRHLPLVRMVEEGLTAGMTEYVVMQTLYHHRRMLDYREQQAEQRWEPLPLTPAGTARSASWAWACWGAMPPRSWPCWAWTWPAGAVRKSGSMG
ncbi:Rossmann-fold NAD(P)-binding domain-containing protein [Fodinicurvata halophila]|uniref:hypothetical protein n=1 Tax=Fodinicurvata halophila TaxID=1419723 RepID=UPI003636E13C